MGKKLSLVRIDSSEESSEGHVAEKVVVEAGEKRTLFFVFKSDEVNAIRAEELFRIRKHLEERLAAGADTKIVMLALPGERTARSRSTNC